MLFQRLRERLASAWRAFNAQPHAAGADVGPDIEPDALPPPAFPPGTHPVIIESNEVGVPGAPNIRFVRRKVILRDAHNAKLTQLQVQPVILTGCRCMVMGPNEVAYLSDLTGLPVCRRCAATCSCGHKVAPSERVRVAPRITICRVCYEEQRRQERVATLRRFFFGGFSNE